MGSWYWCTPTTSLTVDNQARAATRTRCDDSGGTDRLDKRGEQRCDLETDGGVGDRHRNDCIKHSGTHFHANASGVNGSNKLSALPTTSMHWSTDTSMSTQYFFKNGMDGWHRHEASITNAERITVSGHTGVGKLPRPRQLRVHSQPNNTCVQQSSQEKPM